MQVYIFPYSKISKHCNRPITFNLEQGQAPQGPDVMGSCSFLKEGLSMSFFLVSNSPVGMRIFSRDFCQPNLTGYMHRAADVASGTTVLPLKFGKV